MTLKFKLKPTNHDELRIELAKLMEPDYDFLDPSVLNSIYTDVIYYFQELGVLREGFEDK